MQRFIQLVPVLILSLMLSGNSQAQQPSAPAIHEGKHMLSLQWLLEGKYGTINISAPDAQGWQQAKGEMRNKTGFLTVDGKLKQIGPRELQFEGTIHSQVSYINEGKVCERNGTYRFLASGQRKYWRLQAMDNCDGSSTDYVDIYF